MLQNASLVPFPKLLLYLSLLALLAASPAWAQNAKIVYPHRVFWHKSEVNEIFDRKVGPGYLGVGFDFVYRRKNVLNEGSMFRAPLRESFRPWLHYQFSQYARFSVSPLGYMNTNEYVGKPEDLLRAPFQEWRTTFQFFHHIKQWEGRIMHTWRYRYELRWQEQANASDYRYFNRFRFRYRIRAVLKGEDFYENNMIYAAVSNEIGLNIGKNVVYNTFNQNRLYAGVGYRFLNSVRAEVRYVNRYRTRGATGLEFDHGQGLMIGLYIDQLSGLGKEHTRSVRFTD
ncbi:hypothetical protein GCM10027275_09560 [Rhabdobacter roseus]|uniref:DUF2490 domain-containing protein n=1 Tax=Rhabdobacter roseus TaxID=1655419 RepID=A0A840TM77_9BACT|nr:DUF2490 domain-containing protein [Rhabdobacter roseus]MBB5282857.1 hypothetical protein [Rhabdobacter roseus]